MAALGEIGLGMFMIRFPVNSCYKLSTLRRFTNFCDSSVWFNSMNDVVKWKHFPVMRKQVQQSSLSHEFRFSLRGVLRLMSTKPTVWFPNWRSLPLILTSYMLVAPSFPRKNRNPIISKLPRLQHYSSYLPVGSLPCPVSTAGFYSIVRNASNFTEKSSGGDNEGQDSKPPTLMNLPHLIWPSVFLSIKNWFLTKVIIQPYLDGDFNLTDFMKGAKQALVYVSSHLAQGNFDALDGLVAFNALQEIKRNYSCLNMKQRQELQINPEEVYFCAPYQIGIIMDDNSNQRYAEITVIYHCLRGIAELKQKDPRLNEMMQYTDNVTICNYRFIREYTKGVQSEWMINALNHFKLKNVA